MAASSVHIISLLKYQQARKMKFVYVNISIFQCFDMSNKNQFQSQILASMHSWNEWTCYRFHSASYIELKKKNTHRHEWQTSESRTAKETFEKYVWFRFESCKNKLEKEKKKPKEIKRINQFLWTLLFSPQNRHTWNFHWTTRIHRHQYASWRKFGIQMFTK